MYVLPNYSPLWRAFAHLAYKDSKKVHAVSRYIGEYPRALAEAGLHRPHAAPGCASTSVSTRVMNVSNSSREWNRATW